MEEHTAAPQLREKEAAAQPRRDLDDLIFQSEGEWMASDR